jgi:hypothetical protein
MHYKMKFQNLKILFINKSKDMTLKSHFLRDNLKKKNNVKKWVKSKIINNIETLKNMKILFLSSSRIWIDLYKVQIKSCIDVCYNYVRS